MSLLAALRMGTCLRMGASLRVLPRVNTTQSGDRDRCLPTPLHPVRVTWPESLSGRWS